MILFGFLMLQRTWTLTASGMLPPPYSRARLQRRDCEQQKMNNLQYTDTLHAGTRTSVGLTACNLEAFIWHRTAYCKPTSINWTRIKNWQRKQWSRRPRRLDHQWPSIRGVRAPSTMTSYPASSKAATTAAAASFSNEIHPFRLSVKPALPMISRCSRLGRAAWAVKRYRKDAEARGRREF